MSSFNGKKSLSLVLLTVLLFAVTLITSSTYADRVAIASASNDDMVKIAGRSLSDGEIIAIKNGFDTKAQGLNLGTGGEVSALRDVVLCKEYVGTGTSVVVYNFAKNAYFVVDTEFSAAYKEGDNFRRLGAPTSDKGVYTLSGRSKAAAITAGSYTAQVFEKGFLVKEGENVVTYVGAVQSTADGFVLFPVIDDQDIQKANGTDGVLEYFGNVDGEMHPLKDADFVAVGTGDSVVYKLYANFKGCCAYVEYDKFYRIRTQLVYSLKNFFIEGEEYVAKVLPAVCYDVNQMICDGPDPVDGDALNAYKAAKSDGTKESLIALFADCYDDMLADGFVAGYRCSRIKLWSYVSLDLRFGDGRTGFGATGSGERERMVCMVYNPTQNVVYPVYDTFFLLYKEDDGSGRNALGYPESKVLKNKTVGSRTYAEIQIYENGYVYRDDSGNYVAELGYNYDATANAFIPVVSPNLPDRYGNEIDRREKDGVVYINYLRGAVSCALSVNKSKYVYDYYHGRNFDFATAGFDAKLLTQNELLQNDQLISKGAMPVDGNGQEVDFESVIKPLIYDKYCKLYQSGFFCGFVEEEFKSSWNSVFAQQFVVGDSSSMIFGEERPNVSALAYNPKSGKVFLLTGAVIKTWQAHYRTAGAPTSDEYQVSGCDYWFQTFDYGMTIRSGNLIVFTEDFDSPEAYVSERAENPLPFPTHGNDQANGYVG